MNNLKSETEQIDRNDSMLPTLLLRVSIEERSERKERMKLCHITFFSIFFLICIL